MSKLFTLCLWCLVFCYRVCAQHTHTPSITSDTGRMVLIPAGIVDIGDSLGLPAEQPIIRVWIAGFYLDRYPVTVAEFAEFVRSTGYITDAEKFGDAGVLDYRTGQWQLLPGACWHHPLGPDRPAADDRHPVTQVSYFDACAYAQWAGKRLPTEFEWEHAARNGRNDRSALPWGNYRTRQGRWLLNIWQGAFPTNNTAADGYLYTAPVGTTAVTPLGLTDMAGQVWEWTASPRTDYADYPFTSTPLNTEMVLRGGSFLCSDAYCTGYRVSGRSFCSPETPLFHHGFRCARDAQ